MEKKRSQRVKIADAGGDTVTFAQFPNGTLILTDFENFDFEALKKLTIRDDDVILCSYPRSGCHWLWEQIRMILLGTTTLDSMEKQAGMLERNTVAQLDQLASPRIFNNHLLFHQLPEEARTKKTKLVLIYRNPKAVAVSMYHLHKAAPWWEYNGHFFNWLSLFYEGKVDWGGYADYLNDWAQVVEKNPDHPIHILSYEGLQQNPVEELSRLSRFLGKERDVSLLQSITDECAIDKMRQRKGNYWEKEGIKHNPSLWYREGKTAGWKDHFTVTMSEQFDCYWSQAFKGSKVFPMEYQ